VNQKEAPINGIIFVILKCHTNRGTILAVGWDKKRHDVKEIMGSKSSHVSHAFTDHSSFFYCAPWKWVLLQHWCNTTNIGIAKFFTKKIPRHGNKESISSTIFSPSNFPTWLSFHPGWHVGNR
jgi:hypothetical protein